MDEVEDALRSAGCAIVERLAPPDLLDRIEAELEPYLAATAPGGDDFAGRNTRRTGALHRALAGVSRSGGAPARARRARPRARRPRDELPAASHAGDRDRTGRARAARAPRPVGVRLLRVPRRLRGRVPHDVGDVGLHRGERRDARHPGQQHVGRPAAPDTADDDRRRRCHAARCCSTSARCTTAGARTAPTRRGRGINVGYTLSWLRQEENQYLACPPEVARELAPELARLVGYQRGAYALGYFGDLRDPMEALHGYDDRPPRFAPDV